MFISTQSYTISCIWHKGVKLNAPHVKQALKGLAKDVTHRVTNEATRKLFNQPKPKRNPPVSERTSKRSH